jgi:hypothetical protein
MRLSSRKATRLLHSTKLHMKSGEVAMQHVIASSVEIHGEHLALLESDGGLVVLFLWTRFRAECVAEHKSCGSGPWEKSF